MNPAASPFDRTLRAKLALSSILIALTLAGCGVRGPLTLPDTGSPQTKTSSTATPPNPATAPQ